LVGQFVDINGMSGPPMLPDLIEIIPLAKPVQARLSVPGSKSLTNRALLLGALAEGETTLRGALWSEDTEAMVECLQDLGFMVNVEPSPDEAGNRNVTIYGRGGVVPPGGTEQRPLDLFVANAGTAARFLSALLCLGKGVYRLSGTSRMHERPQASLFQALRELGYRVDSPNDKLPALIHGGGPRAARCRVSIQESSQFASALLLSARAGGWQVEVTDQNAEESPYVAMTMEMVKSFPADGGVMEIDPDASSAGYFWALDWLLARPGSPNPPTLGSKVEVVLPPRFVEGWQVDARLPRLLSSFPAELSRERDLGDSIMTAIVLAPFRPGGALFTDLGRLRLQECERVAALRTELTRCGAAVLEHGDSLRISPSELHGAEIETYQDHRMAMCFAILGLKIAGIKLKNPGCVRKTFPDFFQKLAAAPPEGLGATICDGRTGRELRGEELSAD
jgi:3-phosphoshikimate 1-carboxyvinyltransferase